MNVTKIEATEAYRSSGRRGRLLTGMALLAVATMGAAPLVRGQERSAPREEPSAGEDTILKAQFAARLADPELNWPAPDRIASASARDTEYARYDAARWQNIILARTFSAAQYGRPSLRDEGTEFTAGASPGGYDSVYYRWATERYRLQFRCAQGLMSIMVEPKAEAERPTLSAQQVEERAASMEAEVVRRGPQLLAHSSMKLEPTQYGYLIRFQQTAEQIKALWRDATNRERKVEPGLVSDTADDWLRLQTMRTDGYSFVFDFPKIGVGPGVPSQWATTQPGEKVWFRERRAPATPAP